MTALDRDASDWQTLPVATAGSPRVIRATSASEVAAVFDLRRRVFSDEQGIVAASVNDPDDDRSVHALALLPDVPALEPSGHLVVSRTAATEWQPVGTGRLTLHYGERGEALIAWVATRPEARGRGGGTSVMHFLLCVADGAGSPLVGLSAQTHAERFYRRLGFVPAGRAFDVRGIEHRWMARGRPR